jgi:hypothetical protein
MKTSTDIWFCAFLRTYGYTIESYEVIAKGRVKCSYKIDDQTWNSLKLSFSQSDFMRYKTEVEKIKDLAW